MIDPDPILGAPLDRFLDAVAEGSPGAAAGAGAIVATAIAAGLVTMCARRSVETWDGASAAAGQAERLRSRAAALLAEAEAAHAEAVHRLDRRADESSGDSQHRDWQLGQALRRAAEAPSRCAEVAADAAELGAETAGRCEPGCRPDAIAACVLAEGAARIFSDLVGVNLAFGTDERLRDDAAAAARRARAASDRASALA
ncbi:MAG: cyclodeaminase/cyclohydrolase family protein [Solirubrobacterales bacterium]